MQKLLMICNWWVGGVGDCIPNKQHKCECQDKGDFCIIKIM